MEPIMSAIFKAVKELRKAATTARRNRSRCRELAERAGNVGDLLRDSKVAKDTATRKKVLGRLSDALGDALRLVESCRHRSLLARLLAAGKDAGRFDDVERTMNNCLMDLGIANDARIEKQVIQLAANTRAISEMGINVRNVNKKDVAKNNNKGSTAGAARKSRKKKGRHAGGKGKQMKEKAAAAVQPPPPPCYPRPEHYSVHSIEDDPNSCSVM